MKSVQRRQNVTVLGWTITDISPAVYPKKRQRYWLPFPVGKVSGLSKFWATTKKGTTAGLVDSYLWRVG